MLNLFKRRTPVRAQALIIERDVCRLTFEQWRSSPDLCDAARQALANPVVRHMLDVLRTAHLAHYVSIGPMSIEDRAIQAAKAEGYSVALNNFEALSHYTEPEETLVETFQPAEQTDEE